MLKLTLSAYIRKALGSNHGQSTVIYVGVFSQSLQANVGLIF
jgi:hypothetical protein